MGNSKILMLGLFQAIQMKSSLFSPTVTSVGNGLNLDFKIPPPDVVETELSSSVLPEIVALNPSVKLIGSITWCDMFVPAKG